MVGQTPSPEPSAQSASPPSRSAASLVIDFVDAAVTRLAVAGVGCVVETAGGSESSYLHWKFDGHWRGLRVSAHPAAYACSGDYESILVSIQWSRHREAEVLAGVLDRLPDAGNIVADPSEVGRLIWLAELQAARGTEARIDEQRWVWDGAAWATGEPAANRLPPCHVPRRRLSIAETAAIRHRANGVARWSASEKSKLQFE